MKVLVANGTRYGATQGITERMVEWLTQNHIDSDIINIRKNKWPVAQYNGLINGSGIRISLWTKEVEKFIKGKNDEINVISPEMFFICSGYATIPKDITKLRRNIVKKYLMIWSCCE
ncbi:MAG: flavodoxin domain-containing protein [Promethearchaeota archaeon]